MNKCEKCHAYTTTYEGRCVRCWGMEAKARELEVAMMRGRMQRILKSVERIEEALKELSK